MAEISKQALKVDNNQSFPNNNNGAITPSILRAFNVNMIDSMVDEIGYTADSSSWNQQIDALEQFTASLSTAFVSTASFNNYTSSTNGRLDNIESTTASLLIETQNLELFSASALVSISNLNASSASQQVSINSLNAATASYVTETESGSFLITASFDNGNRNLTFTKGDNTTFAVNIPDVSGSAGNFVTTSSFNSYTSSNDQRVSSLEVNSASVNTSISALNTFTASQSTASLVTSINNLNTFSASALVSISNLNASSASQQISIDALNTNSASVNTSITNINSTTASLNTSVSALNSATTSLFGSASLGLTTASVNVNILTFTKGDGTTFDITIVSSGSVTPGTISGSAQITALGFVSSSVTASSLVTASFDNGTRNLTFTKGDASTFAVNIPDVSGSTGNFATTGSNVFVGNQTISGSLFVSGSEVVTGTLSASALRVENNTHLDGTLRVTNDAQFDGHILIQGAEPHLKLRDTSGGGFSSGYDVRVNTGSFEIYDDTHNRNVLSDIFNSASAQHTTSLTSEIIVISGSNSVTIQGALTASLQNGYAWVGNASGLTSQVATSSFAGGGTINTGSFATTGSNFFVGIESINEVPGTGVGEVYLLGRSGSLFIANQLSAAGGPSYASISHITSSQVNANTNLIFKDNSLTGSTIVSGSGNIFSNPTPAAVNRVNYIGGNTNLFLNGQADQLPTITGSAASVSGNRPTMNGNIINGTQTWAINQATNPGSHTYSNNILAGAGAWTFNTMGNTGALTVSNNSGLSSNLTLNSPSRSVAQIAAGESGSNALSITNNSIAGTLNYQGPVSSSTHTITQNSIQGTLTLNVQSASRAIQMSGNIINGAMTLNDNTVNAPTLGTSTSITNNNINGNPIFIQRASSSLQLGNNNINTWTILNDYDASSVTNAAARSLLINGNALFGAVGNNLYASGSTGALSGSKVFQNNIFAGSNISASSISDGQAANMYATIGAGHGLTIEGTAIRNNSNNAGDGATMGSAFFGRWNKTGQGFNTTGEVILAIGTGTSGSAGVTRKTGFLIDSGSNTFIEGTLNVSGSTTMTGSLILSSSNAIELTVIGNSVFTGSVAGNVVSASITSNTASIDFSLGNYFEVTSSVTPLHFNVTNIGAGRTCTLIISASASSSILFSPNVAQPSGSAYSGSLGSIDILSLVAFNTSKVNLVSTKALV